MEAHHNGRRPKAVYINPYKLFVGSFIPNWLEERREVSPGAKLCYARLSRYADRETGIAWPKQDTLAKALGVSGRTVCRYLGELEKHSLIESQQLGLQQANRYRFLHHPWMTGPDSTEVSSQDQSFPSSPLKSEENQEIRDTEGSDKLIPECPSSFSTKRKKTPAPDTAQFEAFNQFYKAYPRHVAKEAAWRAWQQLNPGPALISAIHSAVKRYTAEVEETEARYVAHPATWLNGQRWEDETSGNGQAPPPVVKDLGDGMVEVDGRRMDRRTYERRYANAAT